MSIGASKFYRLECFREIGGFVEELLWDGIDCHRCRMRGWMVRSWDDPELRIVHLRPMGSSDRGLQRGRLRHGRGQYFMGTGLAFITASSIYRLGHRPYLFGGIWTWWGYVVAMVRRQPRFGDAEFRRFLRRYQWSALLRGKRRAIERLERAGAEIWHRHRRASEPREETPDG